MKGIIFYFFHLPNGTTGSLPFLFIQLLIKNPTVCKLWVREFSLTSNEAGLCEAGSLDVWVVDWAVVPNELNQRRSLHQEEEV
jgi:hypothetical protein